MKIPKREVDPVKWDEAVQALKAKKMSRAEAAEHVGLAYSTFCKRLGYEGVLPVINGGEAHGNAGANNRSAKEDPDRFNRYNGAVEYALATGQVAEAARSFNVNFQVLARRVRAAKEAAAAH